MTPDDTGPEDGPTEDVPPRSGGTYDEPSGEDLLAEAVDRLGQAVTEVVETVVGLGVLGVNRFQALRRDLARRAADRDTPGDTDS